MVKKKTAKTKPKKKASKAKNLPGKVLNNPHRVDEIIQRVGVIASRLEAIMKTGHNLNFINAHFSLLDNNSREYLEKNRKDIAAIWEAARQDYFHNLDRERQFENAQKEKEAKRGHVHVDGFHKG